MGGLSLQDGINGFASHPRAAIWKAVISQTGCWAASLKMSWMPAEERGWRFRLGLGDGGLS
jgi:hypothetical protein